MNLLLTQAKSLRDSCRAWDQASGNPHLQNTLMKLEILPLCQKLHINHEQAFAFARSPSVSLPNSLEVFTPESKIAGLTPFTFTPNESSVTEAKQKQISKPIPEQRLANNLLYSCKICGERFAKVQQLNAHQVKHRNR